MKFTRDMIKKKILAKDFKIKYSEAINIEYPSEVDYKWIHSLSGDDVLLYISVPLFGGVILNVEDVYEKI